jgi:arylsulfatase
VTAYEGGISGPAIASWPAVMSSGVRGRFVDGPAHLMDLLPTFLDFAKAVGAVREGDLEGRSIAQMIRGQNAPADRTLCWEHEGNRAIRRGDWKLVMLARATDWELYDLATDRVEGNNLATTHPQLVEELAAEYDRWAERCGVAPWPEIEASRPAPSTGK